MSISVREFTKEDVPSMITIWNEVVDDGVAFPQMELLDEAIGLYFLKPVFYRNCTRTGYE